MAASSSLIPFDDHMPRRVLLWAIPRTLSTALTKCMSFIDGIQVINEPYGCALELGPDKPDLTDDYMIALESAKTELQGKEQSKYPQGFDEKICTYQYVKKILEKEYPGKKLVFCKDMSRHLDGKYDMLPNGYIHTFLIRDPVKVYYSWRNVLMEFIQIPKEKQQSFRMTDLSFPITTEFKVLAELFHHLNDTSGPESPSPVIIDADDLQNFPESILRQYCRAIGIPFEMKMLEWNPTGDVTSTWIASSLSMQLNTMESRGGFFNKAFESSGFYPAKPAPQMSELTPDVIECVEASTKYYRELYEIRMMP